LDSVFDRLEALAARSGELYWKPASLLKRLVEQGQTLEEWMANRT
jgi:3-hydroxyacyl-CoA dehydrogenase